MKRLKRQSSEIETLYNMMCETIICDLGDVNESVVVDFAKQTIDAIKNQSFLSDFEKTVKDYFEERKLKLTYETLADDIGKYMK